MVRRSIAFGTVVAAATTFIHGCGDNPPVDPSGTGGSTASSSSVSVTTGMMTASSSSGGPTDESTSCADALALMQTPNNLGGTFYEYSGFLAEPGDIDYFSFTATGDSWIRVGADLPDGSEMNPVITLFDEDGNQQLAQNNNSIGLSTFEADLYFHVLAGGTYCVQVEDWSTWTDSEPQGGPTFLYRNYVVPIDFELYDFYNLDEEPNDTTADPQTGLSFSVSESTFQIDTAICGIFDASGDSDVYEWIAPADAIGMSVQFTPIGTSGYGSTLGLGVVNVYESDGTTILAQLDGEQGSDGLSSVPVTEGETYYLEVSAPDGASRGENDFYVVELYTSSELNQQEADDAQNGDPLMAEDAPPAPDGDTIHYYVGGTVPPADTDWWAFDAVAGDSVALACSSWRAGSGVRDATFAIHEDPAETALEMETEVEDADIYWGTGTGATNGAIEIATTGTYYLEISATTQDATVISDHYLCGIHVTTPP